MSGLLHCVIFLEQMYKFNTFGPSIVLEERTIWVNSLKLRGKSFTKMKTLRSSSVNWYIRSSD